MERRTASHSQDERVGAPGSSPAWLEAAGPWPLMSVGDLEARTPEADTVQPLLPGVTGPSQSASAVAVEGRAA
eukprot:7239817-Alexandrium_andersonii.AAC.1